MAGTAFQSAVDALFWSNLFLVGVVMVIPVDLAPLPSNLKNAPPSTCALPLESYHAAAFVHHILQLAVYAAILLTAHIKAIYGGGLLPKDGDAGAAPPVTLRLRVRLLFLLAVALSAAGAVLAGTYSFQVLQLKLGMAFGCFSGGVQATVCASCAIVGAAVLYSLGSIALGGVRSE